MPRPNRCAYRGWSAVLAIAAIAVVTDAMAPMFSPTSAPLARSARLEPPPSTHAARGPRGRVRRPAARPATAGAPVETTLASGARVIALRVPGADRVAIRIAWPGGFGADPTAARATTLLLAEALPGTCVADPDLADRGELRGVAGRWSLGLRSSWPAGDWDAGLRSLTACLTATRVVTPRGARERLRDLAAAAAGSARRTAQRAYLAARWGGHPLGREPLVAPGDLDQLDEDALVRARRDRYPAGAAVIVVVGDVDPGAVVAQVREALDHGSAPPVRAAAATAAGAPHDVPHELYLDAAGSAAAVVIGLPGVAATDPDRIGLDLLAEILADPRGRVARALGPAAALAVSVADAPDDGFVTLTFNAQPPASEAVAGVRAVLAALAQDGPTGAEVARARAALAAGDAPEALADELVRTALTGIDRRAALAAVDPGRLRDLAARVLRWDQAVLVTARPPDATPGVRRHQGKRTPSRRRLVRPVRTPRPTS